MAKKGGWIKQSDLAYSPDGKPPYRTKPWLLPVYEEWFKYSKLHQKNGGKIPDEFGNLDNFKNFKNWWRKPNSAYLLFTAPIKPANKIVTEVDCNDYKPTNRTILISVDLNTNVRKIVHDFKTLISNHNPRIYTDAELFETFDAQFKPSAPMKHIKLRDADGEKNLKRNLPIRLSYPRKVWVMSQKGLKHAEIAYQMEFYGGTTKIEVEGKFTNITVTNKEVFQWKQENKGKNRDSQNIKKINSIKADACATRYSSAIRRVVRCKAQCLDIFKNIEKGTFP